MPNSAFDPGYLDLRVMRTLALRSAFQWQFAIEGRHNPRAGAKATANPSESAMAVSGWPRTKAPPAVAPDRS